GARSEGGDAARGEPCVPGDLHAATGGGARGDDALGIRPTRGRRSGAGLSGRALCPLARGIMSGATELAAPTIHGGCRGNRPSARLARAPPPIDGAWRRRKAAGWNLSLPEITPRAWRSSARP